MGKKLEQFDKEKDVWYYQPKIYINRKDSESFYNELKEFRISLSNDAANELYDDGLLSGLFEKEMEQAVKRVKGNPKVQDSRGAFLKEPAASKADGFFEDKLKILKDEIEDINRNLDERAQLEAESGNSIDSEIREVERHLHEIYTWKKGDKSTIEFIRMEFIKQLGALNREKRMGRLNFWKDWVFEKRDRRGLVFDYKSLVWMNGIASEKPEGGEKKI